MGLKIRGRFNTLNALVKGVTAAILSLISGTATTTVFESSVTGGTATTTVFDQTVDGGGA